MGVVAPLIVRRNIGMTLSRRMMMMVSGKNNVLKAFVSNICAV
jgi:hypothetical protein